MENMNTEPNGKKSTGSTGSGAKKAGASRKRTVSNTVKSDAAVKQAEQVVDKRPIIPKDIDLGQYITVKNGFQGTLVYKSKRTGERFVWDGFGAEQDMELMELKNAKNSYKKFFENNWFLFDEDDEWVIDYLGVRRFYKNSISVEDFDSIFDNSPEEIERILGEMPNGQKRSVAYRARVLVTEGKIDSIKAISAIEKALGIDLIEK